MKYPHKVLIPISTAALAVMLTYSVFGAVSSAAAPFGPIIPAPAPAKPPVPPVILPPTLQTATFVDPTGQSTVIDVSTSATPSNAFFHPLGTNGRTCLSCHQPGQGYTITPPAIQTLFNQTQGTDPLFSTVDGSNSPNAPVATLCQRQAAYSELLTKGLIRVGLPVPATAQFTLYGVNDPYHYASAAQLSLFRRPLPTTNLAFLSTVMDDGRNTVANATIDQDLGQQAAAAVATHEQGKTVPTPTELQQIVQFESNNYTGQTFDNGAGLLDSGGLTGGPDALSDTPFEMGENAPGTSAYNPDVFTMYTSWAPPAPGVKTTLTAAQESIARGEALFNNNPITISGVPGLNDVIGVPSFVGSCSSCHNTTNAGGHSSVEYLDLGLTDPGRITPDLPQYALRNKTTGQIRVTSDPGRALITGNWSDIGKFKVPTLRGLAARAPYFHNGSAPDLQHVVQFYDQRFDIGFTQQQETDLVNFLNTL